MKKLFLILAIALLSATSAFAYSYSVGINYPTNNEIASFSLPNVKAIGYYMQSWGLGGALMRLSGTNGSFYNESITKNQILQGNLGSGWTNVWMEVITTQYYDNGQRVWHSTGGGTVTVSW